MPNQPATKHRTIRISDPLWQAAQERAAANGETVTDVIRRALEQYTKPKKGNRRT